MTSGPQFPFTEKISGQILDQLAAGRGLVSICSARDMPNPSTVYKWLKIHPDFAEAYVHARETAGETLAEEALDISDDGSADYVVRSADGRTELTVDHEAIGRSRLRIDTRKWMAAKLKPKVYGEKQMVEHSGSITLLDGDDSELLEELRTLLASGRLQLPGGLEIVDDAEDESDLA